MDEVGGGGERMADCRVDDRLSCLERERSV